MDTAEPTTSRLDAHDVAAMLLDMDAPRSPTMLHRLLYYCQAWHLVWCARPLFVDQVEAWAAGPIIPTVFDVHRGSFTLPDRWPLGHPHLLGALEVETVEAIVAAYAPLGPSHLSELARAEDPWRLARQTLAPTERGCVPITAESMAAFYGSLEESPAAVFVSDLAF